MARGKDGSCTGPSSPLAHVLAPPFCADWLPLPALKELFISCCTAVVFDFKRGRSRGGGSAATAEVRKQYAPAYLQRRHEKQRGKQQQDPQQQQQQQQQQSRGALHFRRQAARGGAACADDSGGLSGARRGGGVGSSSSNVGQHQGRWAAGGTRHIALDALFPRGIHG